jgi:hypothetical protein
LKAALDESGEFSIIQPLRRLAQVFARPLGVPSRRVQILVTENLSEADDVIPSVRQEPMSHCVSKKVRMQANSRDR